MTLSTSERLKVDKSCKIILICTNNSILFVQSVRFQLVVNFIPSIMKEKIRFYLQAYFGFSRLEIQGFALLITALALLVASYMGVWLMRFQPNISNNPTALNDIVAHLVIEDKIPTWKKDAYKSEFSPYKKEWVTEKITKTPFNPNEASVSDLQAHGMPAWLAQRIDNYRQKGGVFRKPEDLQRIYGFPPALYQALSPLIVLPQQTLQQPVKKNTPTFHVIDLNTADTTILMTLKGIGSKRSVRIVKYREWLGGFHSLEQLYEIYGLDSAVVNELKKQLTLAPHPSLKLIHLNECTIDELKHPYLKPYLARAIINYRNTHGKFERIQDLLNIKSFDTNTFNRLLPYLVL